MKIIAQYIKHLFNRKQQAEVTFLVTNYQHNRLLEQLRDNTEYRLEISEVKSKRSIEQNNMLWALLHELERKTQVPSMTWYIQALQEANASYEYIWAMESTEDSLKRVFRAIERIKPHTIKDSNGWLYKCYLGSSTFSTAEMNELLDTVIRFCHELDIETDERLY